MKLCRILDERQRVYKTGLFPKVRNGVRPFRYHVVLGIGGNIGDTIRRMERVWIYLSRLPFCEPLQSGTILKNPPFGYTEQADFYNSVIEIATSLEPMVLLQKIWGIEKRFGRKRSFPNAPRTMDIDIIFFGNRTLRKKRLTIPHPGWKERPSVIIPLHDLPRRRKRRRRRYENLDI